MKFFIVHDSEDEQVLDCFMTLKEAKECALNNGGGAVLSIDVPVTSESIQKLLGNFGGYGTKQRWYTFNRSA